MVAVCEISMMICEIASVNATKLMAAAMIGCETTMLLRSHPIISSPFRRLALGIIIYFIFRAVPFLTLWLPSRHSPISALPFWMSLFLLARVAVLDVDVRIMTSSVMAQ